jgi:outer membrane protein
MKNMQTRHRPSIFPAVAWALIAMHGLFPLASAHANPGTSIGANGTSTARGANPVLAEAERLLAAGNPKQAYMLLVAEQGSLAGNPAFDYLLGVAALDSGKIDDSIIAFERVLADNPKNAGAQMDLGRAYFLAGSIDLAEGTFRALKASNPPANALAAINRFLAAIEARKKKSQRGFYPWGEASLGYDTNLTGVPNDFTAAIESSFNLVGVAPTGNSIKRKAPYLAGALGADFEQPINANWSALITGEVRGRAYRNQSDFNSLFGDLRGGVGYTTGAHQLRLLAGFNRFSQDGQAPGEPKPTNDRRASSIGMDYRVMLPANQQLSLAVSGLQTRFLKNAIEDIDSVFVSTGWTKTFGVKGSPVVQFSGYFSDDKAVNKLADGQSDKSKRVAGLRGLFQYSLTENLALFNTTGFSQRRDKSAFARATEVEFGRDSLVESTFGVNWRFQPKCTVRAQWAFSRNDSNIALYDFSRSEISSNIRCDIE